MQVIRTLIVCLLVAACGAQTPTSTVPPYLSLTDNAWISPGFESEAVQQLQVKTRGQEVAFQTRFKVAQSGLKLAAIGPLGQRALDVEWTAQGFQATPAPWLPKAIKPEDVLSDLMLIYWPKEQLNAYLSSDDFTITDGEQTRKILYQGQTVVEIRYESSFSKAWSGQSTLKDYRRGLQIIVDSVEVADG